MKVLLIRPPYTRLRDAGQLPYFPLGLGYIATSLKASHHDVRLLNMDNPSPKEKPVLSKADVFSRRKDAQERYWSLVDRDDIPPWQELKGILLEYNPDIIGLSVLTPEVASSIKITQICKDILPSSYVVWGGVHPSYEDASVLDYKGVDFVIRGEGESSFLQLVNSLDTSPSYPSPNGRGKTEGQGEGSEEGCPTARGEVKDILGLSFKRDGNFIRNPNAPLIQDISSLGLPDRDDYYFEDTMHPLAFGSIITARGCPWRCAFCTSRDFWQGKVRFRKASDVVEEIKEVSNKYGIRVFTFWDDTFTIKKEIVLEILDEIERQNVKVMWRTASRADVIDLNTAKRMKKAGCIHLELGLESGSSRILRIIKKDIDLEQVREGIRIINKAGIRSGVFVMAGFPQETAHDIELTRDYLSTIEPDEIVLNIFDPMPGSELFEVCREMDILPKPLDFSHFPLWPLHHYAPLIDKDEFNTIVLNLSKEIFSHNRHFYTRFRNIYQKMPLLLSNPGIGFKIIKQRIKRRLRADY